jgi:radical SAM superfamily enzyme YgiQ (UPF0313 family)
MRNVLLIYPRFPITYWGFQDALKLVNKRASLPPLGLVTLAACLPDSWELRLRDLNIEPLSDRDLQWAEVVFVGGMLVQLDSMQEVISRAHELGRPVVVGGPTATSSPEVFPTADVVFQGEVEDDTEALVQTVEALSGLEAPGRGAQVVLPPGEQRPSMSRVPLPRFDLLDLQQYNSMSIQYSRGCPFHCEFCDIVEIFGHVPRVKSSQQVLAELQELHRLGFVGSIFVVDDNFIGNKREVRKLLPQITRWQEARGRPFDFYTEASVNLAADPELMESMVQAGFRSVFVGIETPSEQALKHASKGQNLRVDLEQAIDRMTRAGLEVMGGFIVGFDQDGPAIFEAQRRFIEASPIPLAMINVLCALPGTQLWRRLEREGRLRGRPNGDPFGRANFAPSMDEVVLLRGYRDLMQQIYSADSYYRRCEQFVERAREIPISGWQGAGDIKAFLQALLQVGIRSPRRRHFWRLLRKARRAPAHVFKWAVVHALQGEHMIRYTEEHVVPRMDRAIGELLLEAGSGGSHAEPRSTRPSDADTALPGAELGYGLMPS